MMRPEPALFWWRWWDVVNDLGRQLLVVGAALGLAAGLALASQVAALAGPVAVDSDDDPTNWGFCDRPLVWSSPGSTDEQRDAIELVFDAVSIASGLSFVPTSEADVGVGSDIDIEFVARTDSRLSVVGAVGQALTQSLPGTTHHVDVLVGLHPDEPDDDVHLETVRILRHELAHAVGVGHLDDATAVMYPTLNWADAYTAVDIAALARAGAEAGCEPDRSQR